jgi:hypothetical protein
VTQEQLVKDYRKLKKRLGRRPLASEFTKRCHRTFVLRSLFGAYPWSKLLMAAGEKPRSAELVSRRMLIDEYRMLKEKLGRQPFYRDYEKTGFTIGTITKKFGTPAWRRLVLAAGDQPLVAKNLPASHLIRDFLNLQEKLGRRPKLLEYTYQCHTPKVLDRVFGKPGWRYLIKAVGAKAMPKNILTREHLIRDFADLTKKLNRRPTQEEFRKAHHTPKVLERVFGRPAFSSLVKAASRGMGESAEK